MLFTSQIGQLRWVITNRAIIIATNFSQPSFQEKYLLQEEYVSREANMEIFFARNADGGLFTNFRLVQTQRRVDRARIKQCTHLSRDASVCERDTSRLSALRH